MPGVAVPVGGVRRITLMVCGTTALALGLIGIVVPLMPTTCFLLMAAWCYARSSRRMYDRLMTAPVVGEYLRQYRDERTIPPRVRQASLVMMWIMIGYGVVTVDIWMVRLLLLTIAVGVTVHLLRLRTPVSG
ncbi:MAG TPA: YbaN family protein [Gemmatimonadaceae bacterium]|nr:YbaN family protein [Gemmatimonadaceae bacterium]